MTKKKSQTISSYIQIIGILLLSTINFLGCAGGNRGRKTALMIASTKGDIAIVRALLFEGTGVNEKDNVGKTALMRAAQKGHLDIVEALLEEGVDVNAKDIIGWTALIWAKSKGHTEIVQLLNRCGARMAISVRRQSLDTL